MADPNDETAAALQGQGRALRALARSILRSTDGADDVVQDAFATALAARPAPANRPAWLTRVVQNLARRRLRDHARREHRHDHLLPPTPAPAVDEVLAQVETHRLVAEAVLQLGEPYRRALVLRFWHDLPPRAIAQRLGLPVATVKTHLQRGLAELRERLDRRTGERRAWLMALVPIAHPHLITAASPLALTTAATLAVMSSKHVVLALAACLCLGVVAWQPWAPAPGPVRDAQAADRAEPVRGALAAKPADALTAQPATAAASPAAERAPATPAERTCRVVGRIVLANDVPAANARIRLLNLWEHSSAPPLSADAIADGTFALTVPRPYAWITYTFALADAPGYAVREMEIGGDQQNAIADDRLDLGTFRLERGVAVAGRVVEADGSPLRARVRLLAWDPSRGGSTCAMFRGRTVGFAEPGGQFALADRLSAGRDGAWMLAAVGALGVGWAKLAFAAGQDHLDPVEIRLLPGGGVDVTVVDAGGVPIADAQVVATPYFKPIGLAPMWEPRWTSHWLPALAELEALWLRRTDASGHARFANLPRRQHPSVRDANQDQSSVEAIIVAADKQGWVSNFAKVDPAAGGEAPVTVAMTRQRRVAFHGKVATPDGTALPGVKVRGDDVSSTTGDDGRYELPAHTYESDQAYFLVEGGGVPLTHALADIPPDGDRIAHDFVVELRAPVTGRVVDQYGQPVAGVALHLGIAKGVHCPSTPERTGADGVFAFPDAVASHVDLWVRPPDPQTAWRIEQPRALTRRDGEVITLQRLDGPLVDLTLEVVDGRRGAPVSPTEVALRRLHGNTASYEGPYIRAELALGAATATSLRPGRYRATVRASDGLCAEHVFALPADAGKHTERIELWPAVALVCTVDASALPAADLAEWAGRTALVLLDSQTEQSYFVDAAGKRQNYTPNTGAVRFGGEMTFRLERVTPNVPLRVYVPHDELFGEAWFTAAPGADARVTLRLVQSGRLSFALPAAWPEGAWEIDVHDGASWRLLAHGHHRADAPGACSVRRAGEVRWRVRLWPANGGEVVERTGTATVRAGATASAVIE
ncbi:MAG TPA: RNA polymerase sigma factor [Planctomycetota bacterium]|nr:RNA polymerase sigma factor [Planctomycetota bacterium]